MCIRDRITLALGIGTTTAAFSIIDAVLIRPLAYEKPERIVTLTGRDSLGREIPSVSVPTFDDWRGQSRSFSAIALYGTARRASTRHTPTTRTDVALPLTH